MSDELREMVARELHASYGEGSTWPDLEPYERFTADQWRNDALALLAHEVPGSPGVTIGDALASYQAMERTRSGQWISTPDQSACAAGPGSLYVMRDKLAAAILAATEAPGDDA